MKQISPSRPEEQRISGGSESFLGKGGLLEHSILETINVRTTSTEELVEFPPSMTVGSFLFDSYFYY